MIQPLSFLPHEDLTPFISNYAIMEVPVGVTEPFFSPPLAMSGFILEPINHPKCIVAKTAERDFFTDFAVVTGQVTAPVYGQLVGKVRSVMVFFKPLGMHQLFGLDMAKLTNTFMKLEDLIGIEEKHDLMVSLGTEAKVEDVAGKLDAFFLKQKPPKNDIDKILTVLDYIHAQKGDVTISELLEIGYYHRKTLERHFNKMIGLSPKVYAQIYQFKCLFMLLQTNPGITWAQLADQAGYYDQSHMSRYFKEYLKVSPNSIVTLDLPLIHYLLSR